MKYIKDSIDKIIDLTNRAFKESGKWGIEEKDRMFIVAIHQELSNVKIALNMIEALDKKLDTFDLVKYGKLLDLMYERT